MSRIRKSGYYVPGIGKEKISFSEIKKEIFMKNEIYLS